MYYIKSFSYSCICPEEEESTFPRNMYICLPIYQSCYWHRPHPYPRLPTKHPESVLGRFIVHVFRSHTPGMTPLEERSARIGGRYLHRNTTGFELAITAIKRLQTYTLDRTATWIHLGLLSIYISCKYSTVQPLYDLLLSSLLLGTEVAMKPFLYPSGNSNWKETVNYWR